MKPTEEDFQRALTTIGATRYFPAADSGIRMEVLELLHDIVGTSEQMDWLRKTIRDKVPEWPGLAGLRGIFCAFHRPADGINAVSDLPGFTQEDRNDRWMVAEGERITGHPENALRLASASAIKALPLPPEEIVKNNALLREVGCASDRERPQSWTVPEPTVEDREYSRKLLGGIPGLV